MPAKTREACCEVASRYLIKHADIIALDASLRWHDNLLYSEGGGFC